MAFALKGAGFLLADDTEVISAAGLVDGRDPSVDGSKLDGIAAGADVTGSHPPQAHAASHVAGDAIQSATAAQAGLATATQISKLDGIEAAADVTDATNVSAAGAGMVAESKAWTRCQYPTPQTLVLDTGAITPAFGTAGHGNAFYYDMAGGAAQLANPTGLVAGMRFEIMIEADGVNELTYGDRYDFGAEDGTNVDPPDISAMTNGQWLVLYATVKADAAGGIGIAASVVYG